MKKVFTLFFFSFRVLRGTLFCAVLLIPMLGRAADYYWVGGTGVWNDLTHWATTSGGAVKHTIVPSALDNVLFDANSFSGAGQSVTLNQEAFCKDFKWDNVTNNPTFTGAGFNLNVAGNYIALGTPFTFNHVNGNLPIGGYFLVDGSNMSFTKTAGTMSVGGQFDIKNVATMLFSRNSSIQIGGAMTFTDATLTSFTAVNITITTGDLSFTNSKTTGAFSSGTITLNNGGISVPGWSGGSFSTSTISMTGNLSISNWTTGNLTTGNVTSTAGNVAISGWAAGSITMGSVTLSSAANVGGMAFTNSTMTSFAASGIAITNGTITFTNSKTTGAFSGGTITLSNGALTIPEWSGGNFSTSNISLTGDLSISNWTTGTLSMGTISSTNGHVSIDNKTAGNTTITALNLTNGNFSLTNSSGWTLTVGSNSIVGGNFSIPNSTITYTQGSSLSVRGNFTLNSACTFNQTGTVIFTATTTGKTITSAGKQFTNVRFDGSGGEWILQDNFKATGTTDHYTGIFRSNGKTVDYGVTFNARDNGTVRTLDYTGTDTVRVQYQFLVNSNANTILTMGGAVLLLHTVNWSEMYIDGGGKTFGTVVINHLSNLNSYTNIRFRNDNSVYGNVYMTINNGSRMYKEGTNNTFGNVSINYINAAATLTDFNYIFGTNTFGNFTITSNGLNPMFYCDQNNTFGNVSLAAGTTWQIVNTRVQTLTGLSAIGNCLKFIRIYASSGTASINDSNGGANALDFVRLSGITFGGAGATWTASNVLDDGGNTGITITSLPTQTYYWIGGTGNWTETAHWSLSSGGSTAGCLPTRLDHVVFDNNSFPGSNQTVTLDVAATVVNMTWTAGVNASPNFAGSQSLAISGNLTLAGIMDWNLTGNVTIGGNLDISGNVSWTQTGNVTINGNLNISGNTNWTQTSTLTLGKSITLNSTMTWNQTGNLNFSGTTAGNTINMAGKTFAGNVYFDNPGNTASGAWTLAADFTVAPTKFVSFTDATFISAGFKVDFGDYLDATPNVVKVFDFTGTDTVRVKRQWQMLNNTNATLTMGSAVLLLRQPAGEGNNMILDGGGKTYHDVVFDARHVSSTYILYIRNNSMTFRDVYFNISGAQPVRIEGSGYVFRDVYASYGSSTTSYAPNFELFNNHNLTSLQFTNPSVQPKLYLYGSNTINTLALYHGMDVFFGHNQTQTLQSVTATSLCTRPIDLASTSAGTQATLTDAGGTNSLDFVSLKDMKVQGGATWNASNVVNNVNNTGWNITSAPSTTYYWIGGTGNWNDGAHWALSSGGTAAGCSPNPQDDVVFDNNSFTGTSQSVNLVGNTKCRNMTWTAGVTQNPTFQGNFEMDIEGDLNVLGTMTWIQNSILYPRGDFKLNANVTWQHNQVLYFYSDSTNNVVTTAGANVLGNAIFDAKTPGSNPGWTMGSDFKMSSGFLGVNEGNWNSGGYEINAGNYFDARTGSDPRHINFTGTDTIRMVSHWYFTTNVNSSLTIGTATILINPNCFGNCKANFDFYGGGRTYKDVIIYRTSGRSDYYTQIFDNNTFANLFLIYASTCEGSVFVNGSQTIQQSLKVDIYSTGTTQQMGLAGGTHNIGAFNAVNHTNGSFPYSFNGSSGHIIGDVNVSTGNGAANFYFQGASNQFQDFNVQSVNGNANFYFQNASHQFQDVVVTPSGTGTAYLQMEQNGSFAKLDLPKGFDMLVYAGRTQTISNFIPRSTCLVRSKIRGQNATTSVISQASGTVSTEWITLENHTVQGGATFNATDITQVGTINGWTAVPVQPITLFWVGGTGNWNDANKWALVSGGPGNGCLIPSAVDNAVFDANSFTATGQTVTMNITGQCKNMIWNNVVFSPTFYQNGNGQNLTVNGDLVVNSPMTWNWTNSGNSYLVLKGSVTIAPAVTWNHNKEVRFEPLAGNYTINMGGKTFLNNVRFNGAATAKWTLLNGLTVNNGFTTFLNQGELYSNGYAVDFGLAFDFNNTNTKKVDFTGTTTVKVRRDWLGNGTGTTFVSGGAAILLESSANENLTFTGGNITTYGDLTVRHLNTNNLTITFNGNNTFGEVNFEYTNRKDITINGNSTFGGFTVTQDYGVTSNIPQHTFSGSNNFASFVILSLGVQGPEIAFAQNNTFGNLISAGRGTRLKFGNAKTQTINGELLILGTGGQPIFFNSTTAGAQATISKASGNVCLDYVWIKDINATGGATYNAGVNGSNLGNNTGINFGSACAAYYWVGGSGNWTDLNHWATSSGGSTLHTQLPTEIDDVYFDANSFTATGQTVSFDDPNAECRNMNWFSALYQPTLAGAASDIDIYGSLTLTPFMTQNWTGIWNFVAQSGLHAIDTKGKTLQDMNVNALTGLAQISLLNDLKINNDLTLTRGTFKTDGNNVETKNFNVVGAADRSLELGASQLTITNGKWDVQDVTNLTITPGTSKIVVQSEGASSHFYGGGKTYNDLRFHTNTTMSSTMTGSNTFNQLKVEPGVTLSLEAGSTQTVTDPVISGTCTKTLTIKSTVPGTQANVSKASGTVNASFLTLQDINATGGATFNASQATDNGNNSGWNFISVPALLVTVAVTNATCPTPNNGTAAAVVTGGVTPFSYLWNTIETTQTLSNLSQGSYTVTVTDGAGCVASATGTVSQPATYGFAATTTGDLICFGASDGEASVSAPGGQTPLIYLWSNNATTATLTGLGVGTYTVTVTDGNNCKATNTATVTQRPDINAAISVNSPPCINTDMALSGSGTGVNLMYDWDFPTLGQTASGQTTTVNFPAANTHTVQLTVTDENACSDVTTVAIVINTALALNGTITNASDCTGSCDGAVVLTASGGQAPYQFAGTAFDYDFTGTTLNASLFEKDNIKTYTQNGDLTVSGGTNAWTAYLNTTGTFSRVVGSEFTFSYYNATSTLGMIGWHGNSTGNANRYFDLIYAFYFNNATLQIYEDGTSRGTFTAQVPGGFSTNTWYEGKIILKSSGADYYLRKQGQPTYTLIYASSFSTETALRLGMTINTSAVGNPVKTDNWFVYGANPFTTGLCPGDYTYIATDANGCTDSYTATVGANDPNPPTASCKNHTVSLNALSSYTLTAADINDNSSDDCGSVSLAVNATVFTCSDIGANTVQLTVTDNNNNTSTCSATITVQAAEIDVQGNSTSIADGDNMPAATDHTDFGQYSGTPITRTFTILNTGSSDLTLGANAISITGADAGLFAVANVTLPAVVSGPNGTLTFDVIYTPVAIGIHTATIEIASDECNEAAYNFAIQGELSCTTPTFTTCPAAPVTANTATGQCSATVTYTVSAGGIPTPALTYVFTGATTGSGSGTGSGETFNKGNTTVTVTATNTCGAPTCVFTVTVTDNEKPQITCAGTVTINNTPGLCTGTTTLTAPTVSDNCSSLLGNGLDFSGTPNYATLPSGVYFNGDFTIECWVYPKAFSNWSRIIDFGNGAGSNNILLGYTYGTSGRPGLGIEGGVLQSTATLPLNQWSHIAATFSGGTGTIYVNGVAAGSGAFSTPANVTRNLNYVGRSNWGGDPDADAVYDELRIWNVARTQAQIQSAMSTELTGSETGLQVYFPFNQGVACGNNTSITQILDLAPAGGTTNGTLNSFTLNGGCTKNFTSGASDPVSVTNNAPATYPKGNTTVTWTATDASGNTETCQQTVTVLDNQMPTITCPSGSPFARNTDATECTYTVQGTEFNPTAFGDNCPGATISNSFNSMAMLASVDLPKGSTTITWTVTDGMAMSSTTCAIVVTVSDNQIPTLANPGNQTMNAVAACAANYTIADPITDNCTGATWSYSLSGATTGSTSSIADGTGSGTIPFNKGVTTVTLTGVDANGNNATSITFTITVNDNTAADIAVTNNCGNSVLVLTTYGTSYLWSNTATTDHIVVSSAGIYTVMVTNTNGCTATASGTAAPLEVPTASIAVTNDCADAVLDLTTNGTSYLWSNAATTEDITVTSAGTYTVMVTGSNACTATASGVTRPKNNVVFYVSTNLATGADDGSSWADAYRGVDALQKALAAATCGNGDIWVASGLYKPTHDATNNAAPTDLRNRTFYVRDGVKVYGGFAGTETLLSERDIAGNVTTLSGDFAGDDVVTGSGATLALSGNAENAYHVVSAAGTIGVTIDGFTIKGGNADNASDQVINGEAFSNANGGAISLVKGNNTISNNTLSGNGAELNGAAISAIEGTNVVSNNNILNNYNEFQGAVYASNAQATITDNKITGNLALYGTGLSLFSSTTDVSNNIISANHAELDGGGIHTIEGTNTFTGNTIFDNTASAGAGYISFGGMNTLKNNVFSNNTAIESGGGFYLEEGQNVLINNTFSQNRAAQGGGIYVIAGTNVLKNNIFWDNKIGGSAAAQGADYFVEGTNGNTFTNCLMQLGAGSYTGSYALGAGSLGNLFAQDPLFLNAGDIDGNDNMHQTSDDGLRLLVGSPALDAGVTGGDIPTDDIAGASRDAQPDLGAYEGAVTPCTPPTASISVTNNCSDATLDLSSNGATYLWSNGATTQDITVVSGGTYSVTVSAADGCTATASATAMPKAGTKVYVNGALATGDDNGASWANAYRGADALQKALEYASCPTQQVWVAVGTYVPTKDHTDNANPADNRDKTFYVRDGVALYGGFMGTETTASERNVALSGALGGTVLSGDFNGNDNGNDFANHTENAYHVVVASGTAGVTVDGFTIQGANANGSGSISVNSHNVAQNSGAGIYVNGGTNALQGNMIKRNKATGNGAGVYASAGTTQLHNNGVSANEANNGAGIYLASSTSNVTNNAISDNTASQNGGGIYADNSTLGMYNNSLSANTAAGGDGGGLYTASGSNAATNNIFWGNKKGAAANVQGADFYSNGTANTFKNNLLQLAGANYSNTGSGNFDLGTGSMDNLFNQNPNFTNPTDVDGTDNIIGTFDDGLQLQAGSPALNAGITDVSVPTDDIQGDPRDAQPDLGAYEGGIVVCTPELTASINVVNNCGSSQLTVVTNTGNGFLWSTTATSSAIQVTSAGIYSVTVTNNDGCTAEASAMAAPKSVPTVNIAASSSCTGAVLDLTTDGVSYEWSNGETTQDISVSGPGTYNVTITGANACTAEAGIMATLLGQTIAYVNGALTTGNDDGSTWANAYRGADALQKALEAAACPNNEIWVAAGTYLPNKDPFGNTNPADDRDRTFYLRDGVKMYGGFAGTENSVSERDLTTNVTTLSGDLGVGGDNVDNAYHVLIASAAFGTGIGVTVDGFTITGGKADATGLLVVNGNAFKRNRGGGIMMRYGNNTIVNNHVTGNACSEVGGGLILVDGSSNVENNKFSYNSADAFGGGCYAFKGANTFKSNVFEYNESYYSAGLGIENGHNTVANNLFTKNTADYGAGLTIYGGTNNIINNTMADNTAHALGGGMNIDLGDNTITNNIFWDNKLGTDNAAQGADFAITTPGNMPFKNNLLQLPQSSYTTTGSGLTDLGTAAADNIFAQDPKFINAADMDGADNILGTADDGLNLQICSPASNSGLNSAVGSITNDFANQDRIRQSVVDMGAYETDYLGIPTATVAVANNCGNSVLSLTTNGTSYLWSNTATTDHIVVTSAGTYTVMVTNTDACTMTASGTAAPLEVPSASIAVMNNCGNSVLSLTTSGTSYLWSNAATTDHITVTSAGTYTVMVTGSNGCTATASEAAAPLEVPSASIAVMNNCGNSVLVLTTNGTSYLWSNTATTDHIVVSSAGTYTVMVTNTDGCTATASETAAPNSDNQMPTITCPGGSPFARNTDATECNYTVQGTEFNPTTFGDNCPGATISNDFNSSATLAGADLPKGSTTITWTVTDGMAMSSTTCAIVVTVSDNEKPTLINCPANLLLNTGDDGGADCEVTVSYTPPTFADNCDGTGTATWVSGPTSGASLNVSGSPYTVVYTKTDVAGNAVLTNCSFTVAVTDNEAPSISCPTNQTVPPTNSSPCSAVVNAINGNYNDNCSGSALAYALTGATTGSGSGQASGQTLLLGTTTVTYTVTDGAGLTSACSFTVTVTNCNITFSGTIKWEHDGTSGVNNATANLTGAGTGNDGSDTNGDYLISIPYATGNFTVKPVKNINRLNGVTAADVTAIQQHLTTVNPITNPYKLVAADINRSNSISTFDANVLSQCLIGNPSALAQFSVFWRFMPQTHNLVMPPWGFPEQINLTGVSTNQSGLNFKGVKIGDVVSTWANPANFGAGEPLVWQVQDRVLQAGETVEAEFRADQLDDLTAFQFVLHFDPARLRLDSIEPLGGLPALGPDNFGTYNLAAGEIRVVWAGDKALALGEATPVFRLRFTALAGGQRLSEALKLDAAEDADLPARVYNSALAESGVQLRYREATGTAGPGTAGALLLQNRPNPFSTTTTIGFVLPDACDATLRVFDVNGRLLHDHTASYPAGEHALVFDFRAEAASGVLYYELTTPWGVLAKKMVLVGN